MDLLYEDSSPWRIPVAKTSHTLHSNIDYTYEIKDKESEKRYKDFLLQIMEALKCEDSLDDFTYNPEELQDLSSKICREPEKYTKNHRFISRYSYRKIVEMLTKCSSSQIQLFRGILLAVYRDKEKNSFDELDVITLSKMRNSLDKSLKENSSWDNIQKLQIDYLISNLDEFISKLS